MKRAYTFLKQSYEFISHSGRDRFLIPDTTPIAAKSVITDVPP